MARVNPMIYDLIIIGGGINGCAIARDAAGRGLSVCLCEKNDLASGTSSASTKLIHGGLRYLELFEFKLVHEALAERERLLVSAPHIIWPLKFVLPHERGRRPIWILRLGLFLYDHLSWRKRLEGSRMVRLSANDLGAPLREEYSLAFTYSDCWVDDSRFVVLNALDAKERGAQIKIGACVNDARRVNDLWQVKLTDGQEFLARSLVNAAGPWVSQVIDGVLRIAAHKHMRLVQGSHIVTRKLYSGDQAYILQNIDGRIVFVIPYEQEFTLIGTTDVPYEAPPGPVTISDSERDYLLSVVNHYWRLPVTREEIIHSYSGLRPLYDDGALNASVVTRDYAFDLDVADGRAPALSIFGGKLTTSRRLAEHAVDQLSHFFTHAEPAWTKDAKLPGGERVFEDVYKSLRRQAPFLSEQETWRLARAYGARADRILNNAKNKQDLGRDFGCGLFEAEVNYLIEYEWARCAADILWRRSKLGLRMSASQQQALSAFMGG
jgi:glycerol-3-phosphate dehydrogenase